MTPLGRKNLIHAFAVSLAKRFTVKTRIVKSNQTGERSIQVWGWKKDVNLAQLRTDMEQFIRFDSHLLESSVILTPRWFCDHNRSVR